MKNVRVKVRLSCNGRWYDIIICIGRRMVMQNWASWKTEKAAIRNAKVMAKIIGIKYDPEIIKQYGC